METSMNLGISVFLGIVFALFAPVTANAQIFPEDAKMVNPVVVMAQAVVKKGESCTQVTARAGYPLTADACNDLLEAYGRKLKVNTSNPMMQIIVKDRPVFVGDEFVYIITPAGNGWVFIPWNEIR